jgi:hypothetical protein
MDDAEQNSGSYGPICRGCQWSIALADEGKAKQIGRPKLRWNYDSPQRLFIRSSISRTCFSVGRSSGGRIFANFCRCSCISVLLTVTVAIKSIPSPVFRLRRGSPTGRPQPTAWFQGKSKRRMSGFHSNLHMRHNAPLNATSQKKHAKPLDSPTGRLPFLLACTSDMPAALQ